MRAKPMRDRSRTQAQPTSNSNHRAGRTDGKELALSRGQALPLDCALQLTSTARPGLGASLRVVVRLDVPAMRGHVAVTAGSVFCIEGAL